MSDPAASCPFDAFKNDRQTKGVLPAEIDGSIIPMLLRYQDVREAAKDWQTYSSNAPFRVPIPSEEAVRSVRQLPIETDPPEHTEYRALVEPFFRHTKEPDYIAKIEAIVADLVEKAVQADALDLVSEFALPLQSRALTCLLNLPESEADEWIAWGIHVFYPGETAKKEGTPLDAYIERQIDRATSQPGDDFFSALTQAKFQGRPLNRDEMRGFSNLVFAGGRDTIIHTTTSILAHFAAVPGDLILLRQHPKVITTAVEEFVRAVSPLTHIGRVCPVDTDVHGIHVPAGERISLCWASANADETVFDDPESIRLDRKPNPHIGFGYGAHTCLGAPHARLLLRTLLAEVAAKVDTITILKAVPTEPDDAKYRRQIGYTTLNARLSSVAPSPVP